MADRNNNGTYSASKNGVDKTPAKKLTGKDITSALRIYRFILPYKWQFIVGMMALVISTSVVSFIPGGFGKLVDAAAPSKDAIEKVASTLKSNLPDAQKIVESYSAGINPEKLKEIGGILGIVLLIQAVLSFVRIYLFEYVAQNAMASV